MPSRKIEFVNGEIYHITIRGVDGREIFIDDEDRWRGIFGLYEFNREESVTIRQQREKREKLKKELKSRRGPASAEIEAKLKDDFRTRLVDILAFVFMPNHLHLILRQINQGSITAFIQKFNTGYAMYFNSRHTRKGTLFQGRFNARHIDGDEYLKTAFVYVHTNPIAIIEPNWKDGNIKNPRSAIKFLEKYRWSSYLDYIGKNNFPSVTQRDFGLKIFAEEEINYSQKGIAEIQKYTKGWIMAKSNL